jgi:hypothetical protein
MLKHFENKYHPKSLVSLCDRRFYNGELLKTLGFSFVKKTRPSFHWCKNKVRLSKYKYDMKNIGNILKDGCCEGLNFHENMKKNGWERVYDCGYFVFEKIF